jgi:predicted transposase/invertase (TIGR01784 family)
MEKETKNIDHDGLFKRLLTQHFEEFLEGFFPEVHKELDFSGFGVDNFLSQEQMAEIDSSVHRMDVVAKVKPKSTESDDAYLVVFVEAQSTRPKEFMARMFRYFAHLYLKYNTMIIPIVIYSDKAKWRDENEWNNFQMEFAGHKFLDFKFLVLKPSMLSIRDYLRSTNPAQLALASLMDLDGKDLSKMKLSLVRGLFGARLTESKLMNIFEFVDVYMDGDSEELKKELDLLNKEEFKGADMLVSYWKGLGAAEVEEKQKESLFTAAKNLITQGVTWEIVTSSLSVSKPEYEQWLASK